MKGSNCIKKKVELWFYEVSFNIRKYLSSNFISCKEAVSNGDESSICVKKVFGIHFFIISNRFISN